MNCDAVVTALEDGTSASMLKNLTSGKPLVSYKSLDFKKGIDHEAVSAHDSILKNLLIINPTGIYSQKVIHTALVTVLEAGGLKSDAEVDAYKIRVMLSHIRLMSQRNLPVHLTEHVAASCSRLVALLSVDKDKDSARPQASTHTTQTPTIAYLNSCSPEHDMQVCSPWLGAPFVNQMHGVWAQTCMHNETNDAYVINDTCLCYGSLKPMFQFVWYWFDCLCASAPIVL